MLEPGTGRTSIIPEIWGCVNHNQHSAEIRISIKGFLPSAVSNQSGVGFAHTRRRKPQTPVRSRCSQCQPSPLHARTCALHPCTPLSAPWSGAHSPAARAAPGRRGRPRSVRRKLGRLGACRPASSQPPTPLQDVCTGCQRNLRARNRPRPRRRVTWDQDRTTRGGEVGRAPRIQEKKKRTGLFSVADRAAGAGELSGWRRDPRGIGGPRRMAVGARLRPVLLARHPPSRGQWLGRARAQPRGCV